MLRNLKEAQNITVKIVNLGAQIGNRVLRIRKRVLGAQPQRLVTENDELESCG
jgi:predicted MarR family transcription regulator